MQTRVLIVDRNPGLPGLLRSLLPELEFSAIQGGAATELAVAECRPMVALVDLETPDAEYALATLREERVPVVLVSENEDESSPRVADLVSRFRVARFVQRPFPLLELGDVLQEAGNGTAPVRAQRSTRERHPGRVADPPVPDRGKRKVADDPPRKTKKKKARKRAQDAGQVPAGLDLSKLLARELKLTEKAEPWTVLGLPATESQAVVITAGKRLLDRYEPIARDEQAKPELRELAKQMAERVRWAMANAKPPEPEKPEPQVPREQRIFSAGVEAMQANNWENAVRCFRKVHNLAVNEPRYMGYYGWALWMLADQKEGEEQERCRSEGEEFLRLCDSLDPSVDTCQLFLARVELKLGQVERAKTRVERLRQNGGEKADLSEIWKEIRRAVATNGD